MTKPEFEIEFEKMLNNSWQYSKKKDFEAIKDDWFDKTRHLVISNWRQVVNNIIDKEAEFPPFAKVRKEIDALRQNRVVEAKNYKNCKVCDNLGSTSTLLSFKFKMQDGIEIRKIKAKRHDKVGTFYKLRMEGSQDRYYRYTFHCRCERGEDLHNLRGRRGYQLSPDEFDELKEGFTIPNHAKTI